MSLNVGPVADDAPAIPKGFLTEIWTAKDALPRIDARARVLYFVQEGIRTLTCLPFTSGIALITIALAVFLFGGFSLLVGHVDTVISAVGSNLQISAYIKDGTSDAEIKRLMSDIKSEPKLESLRFISKSEALAAFRVDLGTRSSFLDGLEQDNPLPASIELSVKAGTEERNDAKSLVDTLRANPLITDVVYGTEWLERARGVLAAFRFFAALLIMLVFGVIVFLVANMIKLVMYARRTEIEIMQLVGGSDWFIRLPFLIAGGIQGLVGAVVGLVALYLGHLVLSARIGEVSIFGIAPFSLSFLPIPHSALIVIGGVVVGSFASLFAMRRFMDV